MEPTHIPEPVIVCVECGATSHLLTSPPPDQPLEPGDVVAYRCEQCGARWDVVWEQDEAAGGEAAAYGI